MEIVADPTNSVSPAEDVGCGLSVRIVDDEPHVRICLRMIMRKLGVQTTETPVAVKPRWNYIRSISRASSSLM
jgi:hypothetical protein